MFTKEELLELAEMHYKRAEYLKQQELYAAYNYYYGRADAYKFLADRIEQQGGGNP